MIFISTLLRAAIGLAALAGLYELAAGAAQNPVFYPPLAATSAKALELAATAEFQRHVSASLAVLAPGLLAASFVGIVGGLALARIGPLRALFGPLVMTLAGVPFAALAPLLVGWLGLRPDWRIVLVFLFAAFPIMRTIMVVATRTPTRAQTVPPGPPLAVEPGAPATVEHSDAAALAIVAGLRWGIVLGVASLVFGEMLASSAGLGYFIMQSAKVLDMNAALAGFLVLAAPVTAAVVLLEAIEAQLAA
jgi:ABC-type nitrate/sulfonate/bicarbonate transport system permease component